MSLSAPGMLNSPASTEAPTRPIPRLPVLSWQSFSGQRRAPLPCLLEQPGLRLSTSGRASILLAVELLGLKPGDKVLVPTYHCPTMIAPVVALSVEPVFYPIGAHGGAQIEWLERQPLEGVRALLAAHYFGLPQPMQDLRRWCDQHGIALIEDCAHALFGVSGSRPVGRWGDIAIGSLTKFLPVPEGGCLQVNISNDRKLALQQPSLLQQIKAAADIVHVAASHGRLTGLNSLLLGIFSLRHLVKSRGKAPLVTPTPGSEGVPAADGFTLDPLLSHRALTWASAWVTRCTPRARIVERRRHHFSHLIRLLGGHQGLRPLHTELPDGAAPYVFPLWVDHPDPGYAKLRQMGIPVSRWDRLWPGLPAIDTDVGPTWAHHVLQLACHQDLSDDEVRAVAAAVIALYATDKPA